MTQLLIEISVFYQFILLFVVKLFNQNKGVSELLQLKIEVITYGSCYELCVILLLFKIRPKMLIYFPAFPLSSDFIVQNVINFHNSYIFIPLLFKD